jgi:hypothetical protein
LKHYQNIGITMGFQFSLQIKLDFSLPSLKKIIQTQQLTLQLSNTLILPPAH